MLIIIGAMILRRFHAWLVIKAILGAFNIKPAEGIDDNVNDRSINSMITKV
jgi:hypothetical protein